MASLAKGTIVEGGTILAEHVSQFFDSLTGLEAYDNVHISGLLKITSGSVYIGRGAGAFTSGDSKFHITGSTDTSQTTATNFFKIQDNILLVSSSGDIGFGTLNPQTHLHVTGSISASHLELSGNATIGGNLTIGDQTTDYVVVQADLSSSLIPNNDNAFNIGSTSQTWKNIYFKSNISGSSSTTASFGRSQIAGYQTLGTGQTITTGGQTITAGGQTITAGGQTITAGGVTVTAGGVTVDGGNVSGSLSSTGSFGRGEIAGVLNATTIQLSGVDLPDGDAVSGSFVAQAALSGSSTLISGSSASTGSFGRIEIAGNSSLTGDLTLGGNLTIGDATTDSVAVKADLSSSLIPNNDNAFDIGSASQSWKDIYAKGNVSSSLSSTGSFGRLEVAEMLKISASEDTLTETMVLTFHTASGEVFFSSSDAFGGGGLVDIVNDTTPQLGGNLDLNGNVISGSGSITASLGLKIDGTSISPWSNLAGGDVIAYTASLGRFVNKPFGSVGLKVGNQYRHDQSSAAATWIVSHSLGEQYPNVTVYDNNDQVIQPSTIKGDNTATMTLTFSSPVAGKAFTSTGGHSATVNPVRHDQASAATKWEITHSLDQASPVIVVYDDKNEMIVPQTVKTIGKNNAEIHFDSPESGSALVTVGGGLSGINSDNAGKYLKVNNDGSGTEFTLSLPVTGSVNVTGSSGESALPQLVVSGSGNIQSNLTVQGTIYETSAERFKTDIEPIGSQLNNVMKLNGKKFYKLNNYSKREVGLIAEEVNEVYPEFVSEDASSINYGKMVTVLVEAVKELNDNLNQAKERIKILENPE